MHSSGKRNEHPACSCFMCRLGSGRKFGQFIHRLTNRRIRRRNKAALKKGGDVEQVIVSTPYTD